ncbi:efflux RND transporter permease subunit [Wenzhouxiangella marina]|uniref:Cation/multidrug efflux pump n=1 Tax=Wenzhouxiangella marina TaxID=1579979 RepID=A0A0K0XY72_9GAMM|nr:efflux RND transporter permease subunit [Wenzhouxiangella marina]AKS42576.1 Cation/multidrug efflux pump [Wenzhouxiangella marina]MBB6085642.1 multidrug efflux pump subunit AcrB [Wenzhouxiangella marina]
MLQRVYANHPLANVTMAVVLVMGLASFLLMPRERDPEINFNWINMTTILPGASAEDVERLVTDPLEEAIGRLRDVRFVVSTSRENASNILIRFQEISERDFDRRVADLRREVQAIVNDELPPEARDPNILEVTSSNGFPTAIVLVVGQAQDEALRELARRTRQDLERLPASDSILAQALDDPELQILFDPSALANRGLNAAQLADAAAANYQDVFAGKLRTDSGQWLVRSEGRFIDPERLADFKLTAPDGGVVGLDEVARLRIGHSIPEERVSWQGRPAIMLSINKRAGSNTLDLIADINDYIERVNPVLAESGHQLVLADDQTIATREAIDVMRNNAVVGLLLVLAVCWLFLATRVALLVAGGLLVSVAGTFGVLAAFGFTLNITVLLGVVIVLGMLVDVSVVMVEALVHRLRQQEAPMSAAVSALREVGVPLTASVLTTIAAFLPLMLLPGIVGKFMFVVPFVVTVGLLISLIQAFWILPTQMVHSQTRPMAEDPKHWRVRFNRSVRRGYVRALVRVMRRPLPYMGLAGLAFVLALLAVGLGKVRTEFFAQDPIRLFYVQVDMPGNASLEDTLAQVEEVEARVRERLQDGEARAVVSLAGIQFTDIEPLFGDQFGQVLVSLNSVKGGRRVDQIVEGMREHVLATPGEASIAFLQLSGGPPVQLPVNVKVRADDFDELNRAVERVRGIVADIEGTRDISDDRTPGRSELVLDPDLEALARLGLPPTVLARLLRLHVDGEVVGFTREAGDRFELRVKADRAPLQDPARVLDDPVVLPGGQQTHLGALVEAETGSAPGNIRHWNLRRAVTVEADIDPELTNTVEVNERIRAAWEEVRAEFPGTNLDFTGELDDINESLDSMAVLFLLGLGLIYLILATQFQSYFQPMLILLTVPMAFTGVVFGLLVSSNPLSLYTLYGIIALAGIAVNAAIVLIDAANQRLAVGMRPLHATIYAARRRVIPIFMTTATTIAGLMSLAVGLGGRSLLWGPVAVTLVWGLTVSALLTLFVIPVLYRMFMRNSSRVIAEP